MDNRSFPERKTEMGPNPLIAASPEATLRFFRYPAPTVRTICRIRNREALDLDDIEEGALAINDPRAPIDGFLFTPTLLHVLGDDPRAVWYGRHTLFLVGELASYSLLHWDRNLPHYIAHYDPQGLDDFTCPAVVQSLVKATFHQQGCPDLPIKPMECPKSDRMESGFYSLYFAHALLMSKPIPDQPIPEPFVQMIRDFHLNPAPSTSNAVPMRPIRRTATGPLEWSMPDAKMSSTSSTASDRVEEVVNPVQGTMSSPSPMPRGDSSCVSSSGRVLLPASLSGQKSPFPRGCLPFRSAPTNSGAVPGSSPSNGPSAKGKEPAASSTNDLSTRDKELEASATNPPSAEGKERQGSWHERCSELVDTLTRLEAHGKLLSHLVALNDQMPMEEAFNKFAAAESNALIANGKQPEYTSFKEFMLAGVDKRFKANEVKSELLKMISEKSQEETQAAADNSQSADGNWRQSTRLKEMMSIYEERQRVCMMDAKSKYTKILRHYYESQAGVDNGPSAKDKEPTYDLFMRDKEFEVGATNPPSAKGKEPATSSINDTSVKEKGSNASITNGPSVKAKERQDRLYETVMAECTETGLALAKATSEEAVASAAVLMARNRLDGVDFELSELKRWLDFHELTKEELNKACDKASLFMSDLLRDCIINRDCHVVQEEKERLMVDVYLNRMNPTPLMEEMNRLEEQHNAKTEAKRKVRSQYVDALTKKGFLDEAREGRFAKDFPDSRMKYMESLFGNREFLSYVPNHDSHSRAGDNDE
ncbi:uncharacterized protein FIESC28_10604 [Fusarium coffeatum]|uniref:Uncharacterized protein n=1 Tax=Fusarium coffeatum TaxID=231269 RepID=A0A366QRL7_9HYPO|nr:uncharacterized protein FIESC28_10604 [Fusarium coffeatum]RBR07523.1 hypothetical protein FIESC28_10604 [Fusarium coffeatum]